MSINILTSELICTLAVWTKDHTNFFDRGAPDVAVDAEARFIFDLFVGNCKTYYSDYSLSLDAPIELPFGEYKGVRHNMYADRLLPCEIEGMVNRATYCCGSQATRQWGDFHFNDSDFSTLLCDIGREAGIIQKFGKFEEIREEFGREHLHVDGLIPNNIDPFKMDRDFEILKNRDVIQEYVNYDLSKLPNSLTAKDSDENDVSVNNSR